jgi:hypothetical protein
MCLSCDDFSEPELVLNSIIIPAGKTTINSTEIFWSEYEGEDFDRYEIYFSKQSQKNFILYATINSVKQIFTSVHGLDSDTPYMFFVRIVTKNGKYSDSELYNIRTLNDQPAQPVIYLANQITHSTIGLVFSGYKDSYAVKFRKYEVYFSSSQNFIPSKESLFDTIREINDTLRIVNGLIEKTVYYFKVRTYNDLGKFSESDLFSSKTINKPPDTVKVFEPLSVTDSSVTISWSTCVAPDFTYYEIFINKNRGFIPVPGLGFARVYGSNVTQYEIKKIQKDSEYFVKVMANDVDRDFSISNEMDFCARSGGGPVPSTLSAENVTRILITLNWSKSPSRYFGSYELHMSKTRNFIPDGYKTSIKVVPYYQQDLTNYTINDLEKNTTYYFKIITTSYFGKQSCSDELEVKTLP